MSDEEDHVEEQEENEESSEGEVEEEQDDDIKKEESQSGSLSMLEQINADLDNLSLNISTMNIGYTSINRGGYNKFSSSFNGGGGYGDSTVQKERGRYMHMQEENNLIQKKHDFNSRIENNKPQDYYRRNKEGYNIDNGYDNYNREFESDGRRGVGIEQFPQSIRTDSYNHQGTSKQNYNSPFGYNIDTKRPTNPGINSEPHRERNYSTKEFGCQTTPLDDIRASVKAKSEHNSIKDIPEKNIASLKEEPTFAGPSSSRNVAPESEQRSRVSFEKKSIQDLYKRKK